LLSGDSLTYGRLWTPILEQLGRKELNPSIVMPPQFPAYADWPLSLTTIDAGDKPVLKSDSLELPLAEDLFIDGLWHSQVWNSPGWHTLQTADGSGQPYFVFNQGKWESLRIANQINKGLTHSTSATYAPTKQAEYRPLPPLIFYLILLLSLGALWFIPKAG
jgi:hypothetical protein